MTKKETEKKYVSYAFMDVTIKDEKLKEYEKRIDEAYDNACRISATIERSASEYFKEKLTLILFEKMLPQLYKLKVE